MTMSLSAHSVRKNWALPEADGRAERKPAASFLPAIFAFLRSTAVKSRRLLLEVSDTYAEARLHRAMIEVEFYRNRYKYSSKNDDDLPIAGSAPAEQSTPSISPRVALKRVAGAVAEIAKRVYPAILILSLLATVLAATMAIRLALWLPLYLPR
jgi:hypothetical protein